MQNLIFAANGAWQVLLLSLILGAGLPALFAAGVHALSWATGHETGGAHERHPVGKLLGWICFGLVIAFVLVGILVIVLSGLGMKLDFSSGFPTFK